MMVGIDSDNVLRDYHKDRQMGQDVVKALIVLGGRLQVSIVVGTMQELDQRSYYSKWYCTLDMIYVSDCQIGMDSSSLKYVCTHFNSQDGIAGISYHMVSRLSYYKGLLMTFSPVPLLYNEVCSKTLQEKAYNESE